MRALLLLLSLLPGVAGAATWWDLDVLVTRPYPVISLKSPDGKEIGRLPIGYAKNLVNVRDRLGAVTGTRPDLILIEGDMINAFVTGNKVVLTMGVVNRFGSDVDVLAALIGHEMGHLAKGDVQRAQDRDAFLKAISVIVGAVVDSKLGGGGAIVGVGGGLVSLSFNRDQEREADHFGVEAMRRAEFDTAGAVRLYSTLSSDGGFLSSHPGGAERVESVKRQIAEPTNAGPILKADYSAP